MAKEKRPQIMVPCGPVLNVGLRRTKLKQGEKAAKLLAKLRKAAGDEPASGKVTKEAASDGD